MKPQKPIRPDRIRTISGSFSWVDHKFISTGLINELTKEEILIYYFLVNAGNKHGVSFYRKETICKLLKVTFSEFDKARDGLISQDLLAFKSHTYDPNNGIYQVLSLPNRKSPFVKEQSSYKSYNTDNRISSLVKSIAEKWQD